MDAFLKLIESIKDSSDMQSFVFRATNIFFLNDPQEFIYGQEVLMELLKDIEYNKKVDHNLCLSSLFQKHPEKSEEEWLKRLRDSIHKQNESPYVISFSRNEDSLPMWLNYGNGGNGVCLAFAEYRSKIITDSFLPKDLMDAKVEIYDQLGTYDVYYDAESIKEKDNSLRKMIENLYDYYLSKVQTIPLKDMLDLQIGSLRAFTEVTAPFIKTKDYEGEREVRLAKIINKRKGINFKEVEFRCNTKGNIIPYIKIEIPQKQLDYVRIGPLANRESFANVIEMMKKRYCLEFGIKQSNIKYRDY